MPRAIVYVRFSPRPNAAECDSAEKQIERCRAYCRAHDYPVVAEFTDEDKSAGKPEELEHRSEAVAAVCAIKGILVVYSIDRASRDMRDALELVDGLHARKADIAFVVEQINTRGPVGRAMFQNFMVYAELQRNLIRQRTSSAMRYYQANGWRMTRADCCPYGWRPDPTDAERIIEDADEQAVIELIREYRQQGMDLAPSLGS